MKQRIEEGLRGRFPDLGDSMLARVATALAKNATTPELATAVVAGATLERLVESYADARVTEASRSAVQNYERKHGLREGKPVGGQAPSAPPKESNPGGGGVPSGDGKPRPEGVDPNPGVGAGEVPAWARAILQQQEGLAKQQEGLVQQLAAMQGERREGARRAKIEEAVARLPESLRRAYARMDLAGLTDAEFEALAEEVGGEVEGVLTQLGAQQAVFNRPFGGGGAAATAKPSEAERAAVARAMGLE